MKSFEVTLSSGVWYIIAKDAEAAAWSALELSKEDSSQLINVRISDEW